jgi:hypothetical protein
MKALIAFEIEVTAVLGAINEVMQKKFNDRKFTPAGHVPNDTSMNQTVCRHQNPPDVLFAGVVPVFEIADELALERKIRQRMSDQQFEKQNGHVA